MRKDGMMTVDGYTSKLEAIAKASGRVRCLTQLHSEEASINFVHHARRVRSRESSHSLLQPRVLYASSPGITSTWRLPSDPELSVDLPTPAPWPRCLLAASQKRPLRSHLEAAGHCVDALPARTGLKLALRTRRIFFDCALAALALKPWTSAVTILSALSRG